MERALDLRQDFAEIYSYLVKRVISFDPATNAGPGDPGPVTYMEFGFAFEQSGWVVLVFDTRPDTEPDGHWNFYIEENALDRPQWLAAYQANENELVRVILPDGTEQELPPGSDRSEFAEVFGDLLRGVLLRARSDGVFVSLPKAARCELGVEELEGGYGWPPYEERWQDNLANPLPSPDQPRD